MGSDDVKFMRPGLGQPIDVSHYMEGSEESQFEQSHDSRDVDRMKSSNRLLRSGTLNFRRADSRPADVWSLRVSRFLCPYPYRDDGHPSLNTENPLIIEGTVAVPASRPATKKHQVSNGLRRAGSTD